jgi:phosphoenolpyruvate carboxykinase (ATP)|tara:strand:+ start:1633 stop:2832 length:1200 start_codon:yes stop_codon:yes gene_type:complete
MANHNILTFPQGRSPENKYFFGERSEHLDLTRPQYNKIGQEEDFTKFKDDLEDFDYAFILNFETCGITFCLKTNSHVHAQFVRNMFTVESEGESEADWTIIHNTDIRPHETKIYLHLDNNELLIGGTTFLGEIKKGVFTIVNFELPQRGVLPMHCSAFTYDNSLNLMFGLSGTGKTTLSSDYNFRLIGDDEIAWTQDGVKMIESGCYAKSDGLNPDTHPSIDASVKMALNRNCLVEENFGTPNGRLSYPISCVRNSYQKNETLDHPNNIFFLTMDAESKFPAISRISGEAIRKFFETGYTSQMPHTEQGVEEIKRILSPCYGSPFMPLAVKVYSDLLIQKIQDNNCNVFLVNTGMNADGERFDLDYTRQCVLDAIADSKPSEDTSDQACKILEECLKDV